MHLQKKFRTSMKWMQVAEDTDFDCSILYCIACLHGCRYVWRLSLMGMHLCGGLHTRLLCWKVSSCNHSNISFTSFSKKLEVANHITFVSLVYSFKYSNAVRCCYYPTLDQKLHVKWNGKSSTLQSRQASFCLRWLKCKDVERFVEM